MPFEEDTDDPGDTTNSDPSDPTSDPSTVTSPTDPTVDPTVDPTNPSDPTVDPTGPIPQPGPPQLIDAYFLDATHVELVFSEPIAAVGAIDTTKFRLSGASHGSYYGGGGTLYADLGVWNGEEVCYEYCYGDTYGEGGFVDDGDEADGGDTGDCNMWCYQMPGPNVKIVSVANSGYTERVTLQLDQIIKPSVCEQLRNKLDQGSDVAAIFLHYSNNGPGITDTDNEMLEAIAEHWVLLPNQNYSYQQYYFPFMTPFVPIDCPF
ncbi:MAG TPA: hypothetical protein VFG69_06325 [Nannocystaceae bacterium]|nr:hypothetical protein [Nannocystaceae bacterium]